MAAKEQTPAPRHAGFIALLGAPNAGKSTLLNALVGVRISAVTHKVQTTRRRIAGVLTDGDNQAVFVDTPGIFRPRRRLDEAMVAAAWSAAGDADMRLLLVPADRPVSDDTGRIIDGLVKYRAHGTALVINKIDLVPRTRLLALIKELNDRAAFSTTYMISALKGDGLGDLRQAMLAALPRGPWFFPPDQITDISERFLAAEICREKIFLRLHQELPYAMTVETETFRRQAKKKALRIEQVIYVSRQSHKGIVLGSKGQTIKAIGAEARLDMERAFDCRVHLFLFVKVR